MSMRFDFICEVDRKYLSELKDDKNVDIFVKNDVVYVVLTMRGEISDIVESAKNMKQSYFGDIPYRNLGVVVVEDNEEYDIDKVVSVFKELQNL